MPGFGLVREAEPIAERINGQRRVVESVNVTNPLALCQLRRLCAQRDALGLDVLPFLGRSLGAMRSPVQGSPSGMFQAWSLGESMAASMLVDRQWQQLGASIDRKSAYSVAVLSMYLAAVSLAVTIGFGIATLP